MGLLSRSISPRRMPSRRPRSAAASGPASGGTETILMAEDDPLVRAALVRTLTEAGYMVLAPRTGRRRSKSLPTTPAQSRWCCWT